MHDDPHLWLEDIDDPAALDWVRAQNAVTEAELAGTAEFARLEDELAAIYDSAEKIPFVAKRGGPKLSEVRPSIPAMLTHRDKLVNFHRAPKHADAPNVADLDNIPDTTAPIKWAPNA